MTRLFHWGLADTRITAAQRPAFAAEAASAEWARDLQMLPRGGDNVVDPTAPRRLDNVVDPTRPGIAAFPRRDLQMSPGIAVWASILIWVSIPGLSLAHPAAEEYVEDLRSSVASVRENAAISLVRLGERSAVPALTEALSDRDTNVRVYAAYALGEIKNPKAAAALLLALGDPAWCVRDQVGIFVTKETIPAIKKRCATTHKRDFARMKALCDQGKGGTVQDALCYVVTGERKYAEAVKKSVWKDPALDVFYNASDDRPTRKRTRDFHRKELPLPKLENGIHKFNIRGSWPQEINFM